MSKHFWETEHIRLRQFELDDWHVFREWDMDSQMLNDVDHIPFPRSTERYKERYQELSKQKGDDDKFVFVIESLDSKSIIGSIASHSTDGHIGTFSYGLGIRPEFQRKGYASEVILLLMKYFFDELRYQKCTVSVHEWNTASKGLHERLGFVQEGRHRRMLFTDGRFWDVFYYGMTVEEWREKHQSMSDDS